MLVRVAQGPKLMNALTAQFVTPMVVSVEEERSWRFAHLNTLNALVLPGSQKSFLLVAC